MKSAIRMTGLLIVMFSLWLIFPVKASAQQAYVSYQVFYDQLSPYGQWVDFQNYGYVWIPDAGSDFMPYSTGGRWIMTEYGWTWLSYYDWGWAPFHYGRWDYDNYYGWFWVPDNEWGPAWVNWRGTDGYYGWSPMGPGITISMSFGNEYNIYNNHWIFVRDRYFGRQDMYRYYASQNDYDRIYRSSRVINNTYIDNSRHITYIAGPDRSDVQRVTGRRVSSYAIQENNTPGQNLRNGRFSTYRPEVRKNNDNQQRPSPTRVTNLQDVKRPSERSSSNLGNSNMRSVQQQNAVNRQNAVNQQNAVNRQNAADKQNTARRQNAVNQQNVKNNAREAQQQNAVKAKNAEKEQRVNNTNNQKIKKSEDPKKSVSEKPIRRIA